MTSTISVRVLGPADAVAARDLRLEGLRTTPENFGSSWEEEAVHPLAWWEDRLRGPGRWLGAESGKELVGLTVVSLNPRMKLAHNADIGAVFVRGTFRQRGVGAALMQSAMEFLREKRIAYATLTVSAENVAAQRLYARFGFTVCGQLERGLCVHNRFYDELLMRTRIA
ncbi:MAG: GNAT family N-acetyltransferase [Alphaproteobacteria bacterium]|nr:GNAT family N-acetyltransferase [Alphaproteobacteria bacterium]